SVDIAPDRDTEDLLLTARSSDRLLANVLAEFLPQRFAQRWVEASFENIPIKQIAQSKLREIAARLHDWRVRPSGTVGYKKAEVTVGGIDTRHLSSKTMAVRDVPGLYFIGEVVDVTGWLGGYSFQWAWSSGFAAGQVV